MKGLDLRKLKKVKEDNKVAILSHPDGHEVKIAKGGISPSLRDQLSKLKMNESEKEPKMAEGTDPSNPEQAPLEISPVDPNSEEGRSLASAQPMDPNSPAQAQDTAPEAPSTGPAQIQDHSQDVVGDPNQTKQQMLSEDQAWQQDLMNGHIKPETYHDLFAKKDTLGKIGTLFGLMVSGGGAGLTHQPNAVLQMMNNEIKNDLDAQVQSKTNAYNFLRLNQAERLHQGQLAKMVQEGKLSEAEAKAATTRAGVEAYGMAQMQMNRAALHKLVVDTNKLPVGSPQRAQAMATLSGLYGVINDSSLNIADRAAVASAYANSGIQTTPQKGESPIDYNKMNQLEVASQRKIPGAPTEHDLSEMTKEATMLEENQATRKMWEDSFQRLDKMFLAGKLNPNMVAAEQNALSAQLAHQTVKRYNDSEAHAQAQGMFPDWRDWGGARPEKWRKGHQFFDAPTKAVPTLKRFGVLTPSQQQPTQAGGGLKEGQTGKFNGRPVVVKNGSWTYQ